MINSSNIRNFSSPLIARKWASSAASAASCVSNVRTTLSMELYQDGSLWHGMGLLANRKSTVKSRRGASNSCGCQPSDQGVTSHLDRLCLLDLFALELRPSLVTDRVPIRALLAHRLAQPSASAAQHLFSLLKSHCQGGWFSFCSVWNFTNQRRNGRNRKTCHGTAGASAFPRPGV